MLLDEGIPGSVTLRKFRAPGRIHGYKKTFFAGSLVVTGQRFAALLEAEYATMREVLDGTEAAIPAVHGAER